MNDFELRRQLHELRGSREPQHDLWPRIAQQIAAASQPVRAPGRRRRWPLAVAAALAMAVGAGVFSLALQDHGELTAHTDTASRSGLSVSEQIQRARELAASGDPRLVSAEVVLDTASQELELALRQQPDAVFLVSLINRTHAQQRKLARLGLDAS